MCSARGSVSEGPADHAFVTESSNLDHRALEAGHAAGRRVPAGGNGAAVGAQSRRRSWRGATMGPVGVHVFDATSYTSPVAIWTTPFAPDW